MMVTGLQMKTAPNLIQVCFSQYKTKRKQNYVCFICSITCQPNLFINEEIVLKLTLLPKNLVQFLSFNFLVLLVHFINLLKLKTENQKKDRNTNKNIFKPILPLVQNKVRNDKKNPQKKKKEKFTSLYLSTLSKFLDDWKRIYFFFGLLHSFIFNTVDGVWTAWERWGPCACAGGGGSRTRRRMCDNPAPQYDGKNCAGSDVETDTTCSPSAGCRCKYLSFTTLLLWMFSRVIAIFVIKEEVPRF